MAGGAGSKQGGGGCLGVVLGLVVLALIIEYWEIAVAIAGLIAVVVVLARFAGDEARPPNLSAAGGWSAAIIIVVVGTIVLGNLGGDEDTTEASKGKKARAEPAAIAGGGGDEQSAADASDETDAARLDESTNGFPADRVTDVIDGDTVELDGLGRTRLIGVDTPEEAACHDNAATRFTRQRLGGETVGYELDKERKDRYGRTLAYLYRDGMHNLALLQEGHAKVLTIPPNDKYASRFERAEQTAQRRSEGQWLSCDEPKPEPEPAPSPSGGDGGGQEDEGSANPAPSGDIDCDQVDGPIPTPPGDPNGLDGNNDGVACE